MTPEDRRVAREALERGLLTVDQVEEIRTAAEAGGLSFAEAAKRRGVAVSAPPPPAPPAATARPKPFFSVLLGLSLAVLLVAGVLTIRRALLDASEHGDAETAARTLMEGEQAAARARSSYEKAVSERDATRAAQALAQARETLAAAETRLAGPSGLPADLRPSLLEAAQRFGVYLTVHPEDAVVLLERARTWELYGLADRARADLEQAVRLQPALAPRAAPVLKRLSDQ